MPETSLSEIETKLRSTAVDPFRFDELVETWNTLFDAYGTDGSEASPAQVERIVDATFAAFGGGDDDQRRSQLQRVNKGLPHAALMVRPDGVVTGLNEVALER